VAERFAVSVAAGEERGALCLRLGGRAVVDLWGGAVDPVTGAPWQRDTLACVFSVTKGVLGLLAQRMIGDGRLDPGAPVARLWPAFAAGGKAQVTVRDVLTHRAGLPAVSGRVLRGDLYDWDRMTGLLAASAPVVPPVVPVYHNMTYGHLLGEILCRAAGTRPLSRLLHETLTGPAGADFCLGLAPADRDRTARLRQKDPGALFRALEENPQGLFARSMAFFAAGEDFNSDRWRGAEIGSGSGHATAAGIARLFGLLVEPDGLPAPRRRAAMTELARGDGDDPILGLPLRLSEGFELSHPPGIDFGPGDAAGYWGAGGATGFADAGAGLAFGYVTGEMAGGLGSSERARALVAETYRCL
jgi:CubicO group peptidase (beta-lactamase class C family)